ncbi:MFS transporter [Sinimarinibacterium thermocellulolyticum]|uniref:MFS transporter n=1 Tax=Sinimarinibacterium thermocellulolyticum TaxID=3170016 RepID=A0ABV2AB63_9GAMM
MRPPEAGVERLHRRLAGFYFFYYATVGAFMPYWAPYLQARGFSALQMGVAFALMGVMRSIVPIAWGWWADARGERMRLIRWASVAALLTFMAIPFVDGVGWIGVLMVAYTLFWHALLPQFEVVTLNHLLVSGGDYSRIRLWGSVGFVVAVLTLGALLDLTGMLWLPWLVGFFWLGMAGATWAVSEPPDAYSRDVPRLPILSVLRRREVLAFLLVCFCSQLSFAPYYNFFTLFLEQHGYRRSLAGVLWTVGVVAEIGLFVVIGRYIRRFGARAVMLLALATTALRWLLTATLVDELAVLLLSQLLHATSFGAYHSVAVFYVQRLFPGALQGRGQAVYNAVAYGVGGSLGSLGSGLIWDHVSPEAAFAAAALVAALGLGVAWRDLPSDAPRP